MPIRLPKQLWEWVLMFSPASAILLATGYDVKFMARGGRILLGLDGAVLGAYFALPLCFVAGWILTAPHVRWFVRAAWFLLMSAGVLAVNSAITFGGCMLVMS